MAAVMFKIQTQYNKKEILKLQWMTGHIWKPIRKDIG